MRKWMWLIVAVGLAWAAAGTVWADMAGDFRTDAEQMRAKGLDDDCIAKCGAFIANHPNMAIGYIERAKCYLDQYRYEDALADLRSAQRLGENPEVLGLLGEVNQDLGQDDEAEVYFNGCERWCRDRLLVDVNDYDACFWLGRCYYDWDDYDLALEWCDRAVVILPGCYDCCYWRGCIYWELGLDDLAILDFNSCLGIWPFSCWAYCGRARCWGHLGDWDRWGRDLGECDRINPRFAPAEYARGRGWERRGDYAQAETHYARAAELNPRYAAAYLGRGEALEKQGHQGEAQQYLARAAELDRGNYQAREARVAGVEEQHAAGGGEGARPAPPGYEAYTPREYTPRGGGQGHAEGATVHPSYGAERTAPERSERPRGYVAREANEHMSHYGGGGEGGSHGGGGGGGGGGYHGGGGGGGGGGSRR
jgi:tetratricopeptide (TPR) repeat protein